jgi:transcriptional regulator with GAF, ATPase, and Fis domain/tetratricopeptide (TPR) repeat protein
MAAKRLALKHPADELWQNLDKEEIQIVLYLAYASPPISIDDLVSLSGAPVVRVLNVMERLRTKKIVCEKKEYGKGIYFINCDDLADCMQRYQPEEACREVINQMLEFYSQSLPPGNQKTLTLAGLYHKCSNQWEGAAYIKSAADILYRSGQNEKAVIYYDYLLRNCNKNNVPSESVDYFLDGVLGKIAAAKHLMPIPEQISILTTAEKLAKRHEKWEHLSKIKLALGYELQAAGQSAKSLRYVKDFWKLAEKSGDPRMLKMATLLMSEYLHWKGKFSEVVRRYEEVVENLEEFGEDEATLKAGARVGLCYVRCGRIARGMGMIDAIRLKGEMLNLQQVVILTYLMTMLSLFEIRQIPEAEKYLDKMLSFPEEVVGHYILAPVFICKAYVLCLKDDDAGAREYLKRYLDHVNFIGWPHQNAAWNFEFLDLMESKGIVHKDWNYDAEIKRMLSWDDIYMKGVSYRYRALRSLKNKQPYGKILADLKSSEKYLKMAGAELELARTRIALGNLCLKRGETRLSQTYLEKAWSLFSKVDKSLFPKDLLVSLPQEQKIELMVDRMISINESLGTGRNMPAFLERVLNMAMDFAMAMRGAFFTVNRQGEKIIAASRNLDPLLLKADQFKIITTIVNQTAKENMEIIVPGLDGHNGIDDASLLDAGIYALICMPVKLGEEVHGYLYLDNRLGRRPFSENHLPFIRLVCSQVAVGLSSIKTYDEMRETKNRIEDEAIFYKREMGIANPKGMIIGTSDGIKRVLEGIRQVAPTDSSVLIMGETGVGKELVAKAIHNMSKRCNGPFIPVNLTALPADLVASELFGHEKGAFTGASERSKGRFELAHGGTIFLDEIGDLPSVIQVKLLRVLQEETFERLGSAKPIRSDFRVIAATNKDLYTEVEKGVFRQDLFYRLNVFPIHIPPLRVRKEDIAPLAQYFTEKFSRKVGKRIRRPHPDEIKKLTGYHWPGNVRELKHLVERAVILYDGNELKFSGFDQTNSPKITKSESPLIPLAEFEREYVEKVLNAVGWKLSGPNSASSILKIKPTTLLYRMKKLGIKKPSPTTL